MKRLLPSSMHRKVLAQRSCAHATRRANWTCALPALAWAMHGGVVAQAQAVDAAAQSPNIVIINIDDMGWGDFGAYGSTFSQTPNVDSLASEGLRFTQFYASAPICSPSRAGLISGQFSARTGINSFIDNTTSNANRDVANNLSLDAPSMPQMLHDQGYATGHFGKWHLGGGRDVGYEVNPTPGTTTAAPRIVEYGYDVAWTQFEGLANRIINVNDNGGDADGWDVRNSGYLNGLNQQSDARGNGPGDQIVYLEREFNTEFMVDRSIEFIDQVQASESNQPFFMNVWFDEVHTPHDPPPALLSKYQSLHPNLPSETQRYLAVLENTDAQIGRLVDHIDSMGLGDNTMVMVMSDNGPVEVNANNINSAGGLRGGKGDVFEGGFRQPLIVRWSGQIDGGQVNTDTVLAMSDLLPSLSAITGSALPGGTIDGEDLSDALLGDATVTRTKDLFWNMNRANESRHGDTADGAGLPGDNGLEVIALRRGDWKLIIEADGDRPVLYNLATDPGENNNLAEANAELVGVLTQAAVGYRYEMPAHELPDTSLAVGRLRGSDLLLPDGASVVGIGDRMANDGANFTVVQAGDPNARPVFDETGFQGQATIHFDGNDVLLTEPGLALPTPGTGLTMLAVVASDGDLGDSADGANDANGFHLVVWQTESGDMWDDALFYLDGTQNALALTDAPDAYRSLFGWSQADGQWLLGSDGQQHFAGDMAELLVFDETLSMGQLNLVANHLATVYNLPFTYNTTFALVPEPGSIGLLGMAGLLAFRRRRSDVAKTKQRFGNKKQACIASGLVAMAGAGIGNDAFAGAIVPGLDDAQATAYTTVGTQDDIDSGVLTQGLTLAARITPDVADVYNSFSGPVNLIEIGGTTSGSGLIMFQGYHWFVTSSGNNNASPSTHRDVEGIDGALGVLIAPVTAGEQQDVYAAFDPANDQLIVGVNGQQTIHALADTANNWNWKGNGTISFASNSDNVVGGNFGWRGGLTDDGGSLFFNKLAIDPVGQVALGQYFNTVPTPQANAAFLAVPEPTSCTAAGVVACLATRRRRRR